MSDNLNDRDQQDRSRINLQEPWEANRVSLSRIACAALPACVREH